jgi:COP9 signalosome complex subunit 5
MMVMDSFALPVEGTETRVNAQAQAYEYMTAYIEAAKQVRHKCKLCSFHEIY